MHSTFQLLVEYELALRVARDVCQPIHKIINSDAIQVKSQY